MTHSYLLRASSATTATGQSAAVDFSDDMEGVALLNVTAVSGTTPSMTVKFQTSDDASDWYDTGDTFSAVTAATKPNALKLTNLGRYVRAVWTITGTTPSFTFTLKLVGKAITR